ncbi:MAG TPA: helix-turn-helix transcriptional regulator [Lachnospiraceae bacterium]|nr:helix-turn-helix transcriptional regulator [Lachnospiraceae bacterium]
MFNTSIVGRKIASLRKARNMTQMELADTLGVSYQAVSNWERGNSMPDISKLPEIADLLSASIDELLSSEQESCKLVERIIDGDYIEYIKEQNVNIDDIAKTSPILKPSQTESLISAILDENEEKLTIHDLIKIAPYVNEDYLDKYVERVDLVEMGDKFAGLAPFLSCETLDRLVMKLFNLGDMKRIYSLAPFLSNETLDYVVNQCIEKGNLKQMVSLAPFLTESTLEGIVMTAFESEEMKACAGFYPFLSKEFLQKLADMMVKKYGFSSIVSLAPFLR